MLLPECHQQQKGTAPQSDDPCQPALVKSCPGEEREPRPLGAWLAAGTAPARRADSQPSQQLQSRASQYLHTPL